MRCHAAATIVAWGLVVTSAVAFAIAWVGRSGEGREEPRVVPPESTERHAGAGPVAGALPPAAAAGSATAATTATAVSAAVAAPHPFAPAEAGAVDRSGWIVEAPPLPLSFDVASELAPALVHMWHGLQRSRRISAELGRSGDVFTRRTDYLLAMLPDLDRAILAGAVRVEVARHTDPSARPRTGGSAVTRQKLVVTIPTPSYSVRLTFTASTGFQPALFERLTSAVGRHEAR